MNDGLARPRLRTRLVGGFLAPLVVAAAVAAGLLSLGSAVEGVTATPAVPPSNLVASMVARLHAPGRGLMLQESALQDLRSVSRVFGTPAKAQRTLLNLHWLAGAVRSWASRSGSDNVREQLWMFSSPRDAQTFHRAYLAANAKAVRAARSRVLRETGASLFQSGSAGATLVLHHDRFVVLVQIARSRGQVSRGQLERAVENAEKALDTDSPA